MKKLINKTRNTVLAENVFEARSFFARGKGLLGKKSFSPNETLWIYPCNNIHTWFMQFPIDAVFVDKNLLVTKIYTQLKPWKMVWPILSARSVFEFSGGVINPDNVQPGDHLYVGD